MVLKLIYSFYSLNYFLPEKIWVENNYNILGGIEYGTYS